MRAFVLNRYGAITDNVRLAEMADPVSGPGEVLIEIHAAGLNPIDFKLVHGALKRISTYKLPRPRWPSCLLTKPLRSAAGSSTSPKRLRARRRP